MSSPKRSRHFWRLATIWSILIALVVAVVFATLNARDPNIESFIKLSSQMGDCSGRTVQSPSKQAPKFARDMEHLGPDYIQFWAASKIVLAHGNPYDAALQTREQAAVGWQREVQGLGKYDFLPYYYPPWVAIALTPLTKIHYLVAKAAWVLLLIVAVFASAFLLRRSMPGRLDTTATFVVCACALWWTTVTMGQVAPWVMLLLAATWRFAEARYDRSAGWALALLSIKPQLTIVVMIAVVIWAVRQRRWQVLTGSLTACAVLVGVSTYFVPNWWSAMFDALRITPLPSIENPAMGTTWYTLLRVLGCEGALLWLCYLVIALPAAGLVAWTPWQRETSLLKVMSLAVLATFVITPYAQYYDLPVLLLPLLWLAGQPLPDGARQGLLAAFLVVPAVLWFWMPQPTTLWGIEGRWLWMVLLLAGTWWWASRVQRLSIVAHS